MLTVRGQVARPFAGPSLEGASTAPIDGGLHDTEDRALNRGGDQHVA
jgi:hypothetical protein